MRHIGEPLSALDRVRLVAFARGEVAAKTRFKHQARMPGRRLDCLGLIVCGLAFIDRPVVDKHAYGREPHRDGLHAGLVANLGEPVADAPRAGDVLEMRVSGDPCHVALVGDYPGGGESLIHAHADFGSVVEHSLDALWRGRIVSVFRP